MRIGYACIPLAIETKVSRTITLKNYSEDKIKTIIGQNLNGLKETLKYNIKNNITLFRLSSDTIPLSTHPINQFNWKNYFSKEFKELAKLIRLNNLRVSMHPGQYTILNSPKSMVVDKAIQDLRYHCDFLNLLETNGTSKLVIHIGGIYGDKDEAIKNFKRTYSELSPSIKSRLVIENDERNYSLNDVITIGNTLKIPVIFDNLHNECNKESISDIDYIFKNIRNTWGSSDGNMKIHYSQQQSTKRKGAHSTSICASQFLNFYKTIEKYSPDIMLEVKDKNISAIKCINYLNSYYKGINHTKSITDEWAKYKYFIMEKSYSAYKECSGIVSKNCSFVEFYDFIDSSIKLDSNFSAFKVAAEHVWGYVKNKTNDREKKHFFNLLEKESMPNIKSYLYKLCNRYNIEYMLYSYYFNY